MKKRIIFYLIGFVIIILTVIFYYYRNLEISQNTPPFPEYDMSGNRIYPTNFEIYDIAKFKGKKVYYFLKSIKRLEYANENCLVTEGEPGKLYGWQFFYSDSIVIQIYVQDFKFLNSQINSFEESQFRSWKVVDFLKEAIQGIRIYKRVYSSYNIISEVK